MIWMITLSSVVALKSKLDHSSSDGVINETQKLGRSSASSASLSVIIILSCYHLNAVESYSAVRQPFFQYQWPVIVDFQFLTSVPPGLHNLPLPGHELHFEPEATLSYDLKEHGIQLLLLSDLSNLSNNCAIVWIFVGVLDANGGRRLRKDSVSVKGCSAHIELY